MDHRKQQDIHPADGALRAAMQRACVILLVLVLVCGAYLAGSAIIDSSVPFFPAHFLRTQDIQIATLFALFWTVAPRIKAGLGPDRFGPRPTWSARRSAAILALGVVVVSAAGVWLVFGGHGMAIDEHWARSDATVIATGTGMVRIPEAWRDYALALQPRFARITPDGWWVSEYLPVNAALQRFGGTLAAPLLAGWSVLVAADLARRLLPDAPAAPLICTLLMVTSGQLLITAMTPFAMTAHLAFNLTWLWLFLRRDWRVQMAAMPIAILAIGLHQVVFFPLFAAPFLLEAWLTGRRWAAVVQAMAICAGFLFWSSYDSVLYAMLGAQPVTQSVGGTGNGTQLLLSRFVWLLSGFTPASIGLMAMNLVRFVTWQNVLIVPLVLIAIPGLIRTPGPWRAMLAGMVLTIAAMTVLLADQGHGWGYRYLHGHVGSACLLATFGWYRLPLEVRTQRSAQALLGAGMALSLLLLPMRAWQAAHFVAPYARADAAISAIDADVVLVDAPKHLFALDLVRNDPLLRNRPKRMALLMLSDAQLARLCQTYTVARFTDTDAERLGLHQVETGLVPRALPKGCGERP